MTVRQLIDKLKKYNPDAQVCMEDDFWDVPIVITSDGGFDDCKLVFLGVDDDESRGGW